jgi:hypothetical protein
MPQEDVAGSWRVTTFAPKLVTGRCRCGNARLSEKASLESAPNPGEDVAVLSSVADEDCLAAGVDGKVIEHDEVLQALGQGLG